MLTRILSTISPAKKAKLKGWYRGGKLRLIRYLRSYDTVRLKQKLFEFGVAEGDTLLVHSAYGAMLGFQGSPSALIDAFLDVIGPSGNLLMVSLPYFSSTSEYLKKAPVFDVRSTTSKMGLVSETFRRRPGVLRSLHPSHPMLAYGPKAQWITSGHEHCIYPCGPSSPFEKLLELNGKILFFGVSEFHFTFHHYLEHMVKDQLPFALYEQDPYVSRIIDADGQTRWVTTYAFSKEAIERRRVGVLFDECAQRGHLKRTRIGNTALVLISAADSVACTRELAQRGVYFYDMPSVSGR